MFNGSKIQKVCIYHFKNLHFFFQEKLQHILLHLFQSADNPIPYIPTCLFSPLTVVPPFSSSPPDCV